MAKQRRYTKNIKIAFYLAECEHEAELSTQKAVFCRTCQKIIEGRFVGNILVSLDKNNFLTVITPLRVRQTESETAPSGVSE